MHEKMGNIKRKSRKSAKKSTELDSKYSVRKLLEHAGLLEQLGFHRDRFQRERLGTAFPKLF